MKRIQVLGPGCASCRKLAALVESVVQELGLEAELEKVTEITRLAEAGVLAPPALVVDGKVIVSGRVPGAEEIKQLIQ